MTPFQEIITKYWGFVLFVLGLCFHAIWSYFQVADHSKRIDKLEEDKDDSNKKMEDIMTAINSMDTKLNILVDGYNTNTSKKK